MKLLQTNGSKIAVIAILILLGNCSVGIFAQDKDEFKAKLDNIKGTAEKITINVDGKEVVFEGKDATRLLKRLKEPGIVKKIEIDGNDDIMDDDDGNTALFKISSGDIDEMKALNGTKKIKVEEKDGKKKVTVTTTGKDGKEETKVYEGEDAEKFLKDEKAMRKARIDTDEESSGDRMIYFKSKSGNGCCCCCGGGMMMRSGHGSGHRKKVIEVEINDKDEAKPDVKTDKK
jgi:hypothetical protein